jgi:hypothetical protein
MDFLPQWLGKNWAPDLLMVGALVLFILLLRILWNVQRTVAKVDLSDWLVDASGKASWSKASAIGGWIVGTFCLVYTTVNGKVPDNYIELYLVYFLIVIGNPAALDLLRRWKPLPSDLPGPAVPVQQEVRVSAPAGASVNVSTSGDNPL